MKSRHEKNNYATVPMPAGAPVARPAGFFNSAWSRFGIDESIIWATVNRLFGVVKAPLTIYFIVRFLTVKEQGLWYTFLSLSALSLFAELGFASIITQFVSHEYAKLSESRGVIYGEQESKDRLFGLIRFSLKFYSIIIPVAILIMMAVGHFYFRNDKATVLVCWFAFSIVSGLLLSLGLLQSVYQGLNRVKEVQINAFICALAGTVVTWLMLLLNAGLWALVAGNLIGLLIAALFLYKKSSLFWHQLLRHKRVKNQYNFLKETLPLQGKYAISWASGFFIFYLSVPATYKFAGEQLAGQLGVTMAVMSAINTIASNWISTKVPRFNMLVSRRNFADLNALFKHSLKLAVIVHVCLSLCFALALVILHSFFPGIASRFLSLELSLVLVVSQLAQTIINCLAVYLRSFKKEPFVFLSALNAVLMIAAVFLVMKHFGFVVFMLAQGTMLVALILPLSVLIYRKFKKSYALST